MLLEATCTALFAWIRGGLPVVFVWFCKPDTIEGHVLCHVTVVRLCTRQGAYPQQSSAVCCGWQDVKHRVYLDSVYIEHILQ